MNHLLPYKPAAVALCELHKVDPEEEVQVPHPLIQGVTFPRPAWELRAEALIDLSQMLLALRIGAQQQGEAPSTH